VPLPTAPVTNTLDPSRLRALLYGAPGAGKTTLASQWYPGSTLIVDLEGGTRFLTGDHFVVRPKSYTEFMGLVNDLSATAHQFTTVVIDSIDHLVRMADAEAGQRNGKVAAGLVEFGKGLADRDGVVMRDLTRLLATDLGIILIAHPVKVTVTDENGVESERLFPRVESSDRLRQPILGLVDFVIAVHKAADESRTLITGASATYETKRRVALPNVLPADAGQLYAAVKAGIDALTPVAA
jgi:SpoVK/Ycf46/Vps4 family AAA+-type ATPase